jgi:FlaA1/EpsC-like NDP-sugar epimerase
MPSVGGFILLLLGFVYDVIVSIVRFFLPRSLKPVRSFADDIVLITGAAHGLGRCLALEFAKRGGTLVLWDINKRGLNSVKSEINSSHPRVEVFAYVCNCADREEVYATAERVKSEVGNVSVVINNAGIVTGKMLMDETDDDFERVNTVNSTCHSWVSVTVCRLCTATTLCVCMLVTEHVCMAVCLCMCMYVCVCVCVSAQPITKFSQSKPQVSINKNIMNSQKTTVNLNRWLHWRTVEIHSNTSITDTLQLDLVRKSENPYLRTVYNPLQ